jgi:hypothetical protein
MNILALSAIAYSTDYMRAFHSSMLLRRVLGRMDLELLHL